MTTQAPLSPQQMALLRECGTLLAPADGQAPGFESADPDGELLAVAAQHMGPKLTGILDQLLATGADGTQRQLDALEREQPAAFSELRDLLICSYLSTPQVWALLGYTGRTPRPAGPGEADEWLRDGILDPVVERGPIYLASPGLPR